MSQNNIYIYDVCGSVCVWASISGRWAADLCERLTKIDVKEKKTVAKNVNEICQSKEQSSIDLRCLIAGEKNFNPTPP